MDDPDFLYPLTTSRSIWGAHCTAPSGGCDASVLGESRTAALERWNRRAPSREQADEAKDAARYRWIRQGKPVFVKVPVKDKHVEYFIGAKLEPKFPECFDASVDAARAKEPK
jgi:hypothetical protein